MTRIIKIMSAKFSEPFAMSAVEQEHNPILSLHFYFWCVSPACYAHSMSLICYSIISQWHEVTSSGRKTTPGILSAFSSGKLLQYTGNLASITSFANFVTRFKSSSVTEAYNKSPADFAYQMKLHFVKSNYNITVLKQSDYVSRESFNFAFGILILLIRCQGGHLACDKVSIQLTPDTLL